VDSEQADPRPKAAEQLHRLALDYATRGHASAAALVRAFEADAAALAAEIGGLLVENSDDEQLSLTARGQFEGQLLNDDPAGWQPLMSPDDVAEHYDPVDLFIDVASALEDEFPGILGAEVPQDEPVVAWEDRDAQPAQEARADVRDPSAEGPTTAVDPDAASDRQNTATLRSLEHLHAAGVLSDAQFEAKKAELNR
jgi:hypothetical protein